jgi:murein L,D-transpeptidase YafK
MAVEARSAGAKTIPVHIFPCRLNASGMKWLEVQYAGNSNLISFWKNLQKGYQYFEDKNEVPSVIVEKSGLDTFY